MAILTEAPPSTSLRPGFAPSFVRRSSRRLAAAATSGPVSTVTTIDIGGHPQYTVVNSSTNTFYSVDMYALLSVIDGATNQITTQFKADPQPQAQSQGMAVNELTNTIYVCNWWDFELGVIDGATNTVTTQVSLDGNACWGAAVNTRTNMIFVSINGSSSGGVAVVNGATNKLVKVIPMGVGSYYIAVNAETNLVYTVIYDGAQSGFHLYVLDGSSYEITTRIPLDINSCGVAVNPLTNTVYTTSLLDSAVQVIDGATNRVTGSITVGGYPQVVVVSPNLNRVYTANYSDNTVSVIDGNSNTAIQTVGVGQGPEGICANTATGVLYVANTYGASLTVLQDDGQPV